MRKCTMHTISDKVSTVTFLSQQNVLLMFSKEWFIFLYFRSQKTAHFQKQSGLNAQLSGMSLTGLAAGQIIGFSTNPRTIMNYKNDLAKGHPSYVCEQLSKSLEVWQFFKLLL